MYEEIKTFRDNPLNSEIVNNDIDSLKTRRIVDGIQTSLLVYIENLFFPWLCLVLFINKDNWKRPIIILLILYWFLQSTGNLLQSFLNYTNVLNYKDCIWPYNKLNWYIVNASAHLFWVSGEIIADWYNYLRTKALVHDKNRMKPIFITCIVYNIVKVIHILCNYIFTPTSFRIADDETKTGLFTYKIIWWSLVLVISLISLLYDTFVIIALKKTLFDKLENFKHKLNNFLEKFKQISELRIIISIIIYLIFFPWVLVHLYCHIESYLHHNTNINSIYTQLEHLRILGLRFTYTFMYIDQVLLRFYVNKTVSTNFSDITVDSDLFVTAPQPSFNPSSSNTLSNSNNNGLFLDKENSITNFEEDISKSLYINTSLMQS